MTHVARRNVVGVLLAGGQSSRMGADKALLEFAGAPMVAWCAAALAQCAPTLVVSSATQPHADACARAISGAWPRFTVLRGVSVATVVDEVADSGPLSGLVAAWNARKEEATVVSACDAPLVPPEFYRRALGFLNDFEVAAPAFAAPEPLISVWRRESAALAAAGLLKEKAGPRALLAALRARLIPETEILDWGLDPTHFASANTPEALERLLAASRGARPAQTKAPKF